MLKSPFVWFGGKRKVAGLVWDALGDVDNYVEPFLGSAAILLARPQKHRGRVETVNDADHFLANFWRALAADPGAVATWADWPVNESDLFARHLWLVNEGKDRLAAGIERDPAWYDAQVAGWWVWGLNSWIGSGWCAGTGPWTPEHLGDAGLGINRKLPHLGDAGHGINRQLPHLGDAGRGEGGVLPLNEGLRQYFIALASRLRGVRVCAGDWSRVVTDGALAEGATVGVFLDPPYLASTRTANLYAVDDGEVSLEVRAWALAHGEDSRMRIVLAGYGTEHGDIMVRAGWREYSYMVQAAYQTRASAGGDSGNQANRRQERLWFSPGCVKKSPGLLDSGLL